MSLFLTVRNESDSQLLQIQLYINSKYYSSFLPDFLIPLPMADLIVWYRISV
jgi:hypothetical protein